MGGGGKRNIGPRSVSWGPVVTRNGMDRPITNDVIRMGIYFLTATYISNRDQSITDDSTIKGNVLVLIRVPASRRV